MDSVCVSASIIAYRTSPSAVLSAASIPHVLWGEDALNFAFSVPTALFDAVYILVPSRYIDEASAAIIEALPFYHRHSFDGTDDIRDYHRLHGWIEPAYFPEFRRLDLNLSKAWPDPLLVLSHPTNVLLIPDHIYHFDTTDLGKIQPLILDESWPPVTGKGRFVPVPTLPGYLEALFACERSIRESEDRNWEPQRGEGTWWKSLFTFWRKSQQQPHDLIQYQRNEALDANVTDTLGYLIIYQFPKEGRRYRDIESIPATIKRVAEGISEEYRKIFLNGFVMVDGEVQPEEAENVWAKEVNWWDLGGDETGGEDDR